MIKGLRILPPIAIGRFGSAGEPVDNYTLEDHPDGPFGTRQIKPEPTLIVDEASGQISGVRLASTDDLGTFFKDEEGRIRPVAPFLEVFGLGDDGRLARLTRNMVEESGGGEIAWRVHVANRKIFRRTGDERDIISADTGWFSDHDRRELEGHCANFRRKTDFVSFGHVRFIEPNENFPEIRLRFTPAKGLIYGPDADADPDPEAKTKTDPVIPPDRAIYDHRKSWFRYGDDPIGTDPKPRGSTEKKLGFRNDTLPPSLFAIVPPAPSWLNNNIAVSRGYFDDACDGFVEVRLTRDGKTVFSAYARICVGPPDVAPDALFVRSLADDLEQVIHGPWVIDEEAERTRARALEIVRRAYETVRFMNVTVMNGNDIKGRSALTLDSMPQEQSATTERMIRPVMSPESVDTLQILALHQQVYAALQAGVAPWFEPLLRKPDEVTDFTDFGRRKMPALMCGADNGYLALTYRQIDTIRRAANQGPITPSTGDGEPSTTAEHDFENGSLTARNLTAQLNYKAAGNPISSRPVTSVANCCPGLEMDFRAAWRRMFKGLELREYDNLVTGCDLEEMDLDPKDLDPKGRDPKVKAALHALKDPKKPTLVGHRLLRVVLPRVNESIPFTAELKGQAPSDPENQILLTTDMNPDGLGPLEWSNALARILDHVRRFRMGRRSQARRVRCDFTLEPSRYHAAPDLQRGGYVSLYLQIREFFDAGAEDSDESAPAHRDAAGRHDRQTAAISAALAAAGELTQGLCSPWQNDYRECSCYYWASARPDYVNVETSSTGLSSGDNWLQKTRSGQYVPDDYVDARLILYDDLFANWEKLLRFQIGGRDAPGEDRDPK